MSTIDLRLDSTVGHGEWDPQTVTKAGDSVARVIDGVATFQPINHIDHRGRVFELFPGVGESPIWQEPIVYSYMFTIRARQTKGWGLHQEKTDRYSLISGEVLVLLYDARIESPTHGLLQKVTLSESGVRQLRIPPGVWHLNIALGANEVLLVNHPTERYRATNPDRILLSWESPEIPVDVASFFPNQLKAPEPADDC